MAVLWRRALTGATHYVRGAVMLVVVVLEHASRPHTVTPLDYEAVDDSPSYSSLLSWRGWFFKFPVQIRQAMASWPPPVTDGFGDCFLVISCREKQKNNSKLVNAIRYVQGLVPDQVTF